MPGPGDAGPVHVLPRPPLATWLTADLREALPRAVFATNPCRVRYGTQQLVLFRDDVEHRMRRQVLMPPPGASPSDSRPGADLLEDDRTRDPEVDTPPVLLPCTPCSPR